MKTGSLGMSGVGAADPAEVYRAWLSGRAHAAMTGAHATSRARVVGSVTAWDGYLAPLSKYFGSR